MFRLQFVLPNRSTLRGEASHGYWTRGPISDPRHFPLLSQNAVDAVLRLVQPARMHVITVLHP